MGFLDSVLKVFIGDKSEKDVKAIQPIVDKIKAAEKELTNLSLDELRSKTVAFKEKIKEATKEIDQKIIELGKKAEASEDISEKEDIYAEIDGLKEESYTVSEDILNEILPEAFAVVKETAKRFVHNENLVVTANEFDREISAEKDYVSLDGDKAIWKNSWNAAGKEVTWDMIHYDVQLIGGVAMHQGKIAEMHTGEGKTLVATLPVYLNALTGRGVHLVTVNDYLAKRDSAWMAPIFQFHGMSVDCIDYHRPNSAARRKAYNADITYGTNNEFGFDYLRDNMSHAPDDLVQRPHNYAIVDEVDSVLIDDARTPLIISGPVPKGDVHEFDALKPQVSKIVEAQRKYLVGVLADAKKLIASGDTKEGGFLLYRVYRGLPKNKALIKFLSEEGIKQLLQKTENHYMQDNNREMHKIDAELYFTIEEKSNQIDLTDKGVEFLSGKEDPNFFVMPEMGMEISKIEKQGLSKEEEADKKEELFREFSVKSERIHTLRQLLKAYTLFEKDTEYVVMENKVKIVDEQTGRIMDGRRYSDGLHQAIEAKEQVKIEDATQTFATITLQNYFRMYNKLSGMTGTAVTEAGEFWEIYELDVVEIPTNRPIARKDKEDLVYKTKREKYNAVIEEVTRLSQAGRPVLIGTTSVEISELLSRMLQIRKVQHNVLNAKLHKKEAEVVEQAGQKGMVTIATNMAGRGTDIKLSKEVKAAGGLAIIGTERHDSRRVDRQLRGRSGRQGDPGSSQFYVSLEDNLMRLFGSERIAKLMDRMGLEEGEVIQHGMISKSIERAQKKVEENNFGVRKRLLEYDDVMNAQREVIYKRRYHALFGERLRVDIANMIFDIAEVITDTNKTASDFKNFEFELIRYFSMDSPVTEQEFEKMNPQKLAVEVYKKAYEHYQERMKHNAELAYPVIKNVYEEQGSRFERIAVPFSDGNKTLQVATNLEKAYETEGKQLITDFEKNITLAIIDDAWKTHLRKMDELKQSVQLAVHEQKDPLLIYKFEAFELFKVMLDEVNKDVISFLYKGEIPQQQNNIQEAREAPRERVETSKEEIPNIDERAAQSRAASQTQAQQRPQVTETITRNQPKIGRNDKVTIKNVANGESKTVKYKQAIPLIESGQWVLSQH
ncbi:MULTISPECIES: preprotein translocase subunit SecA [Mesonia]|uniref:Protein translocase subunit SecA n=1 Tax=Mesonia oceanica TaxID=2687242 RepID=A0AC61YAE6_9FLAO|nr:MULTISPECIES: preprotein translocase subunit SecA [Mesonia]MAN29045.1 preprotein translocase subunit SecA [Mesonia sp.]MAQ40106.1 preprotein translocase subunit SecA [Mesonia sp.]MBJ96597.1 preprotein translocase subunit SecA [Flavobacteriaceae bacterium]VVV01290.1 Protein translocase subunit SecA [Mesonia oceanica]|tara:strand:+ start:1544 stop:4900 length:3357 start_codon:yes stop_codon:yes gene_type:complete